MLRKNPLEEERAHGLRQIFPGPEGDGATAAPAGAASSLDFGAALGIWAAICHMPQGPWNLAED
ncbi:MAG: hypothetical protein CW342_06310 [Thermoactinomycetaceae bacterium]|nr:hypothetical protein [Bacillota bacterium]MBO2532495.1 hypothetical protein [Thermoactinomycetaceae bacterium]